MKPLQTVSASMSFICFLMLVAMGHADYNEMESLAIDSEEQIVKRPFCNAFTGCGRKRSEANEDVSHTDRLLQRIGQQILKQAKLDAANAKLRQKGEVKAPWLEYLNARKKRMASFPRYLQRRFQTEREEQDFLPAQL